ncbi:MAG: cell division protein FtsQ/DivIB [Patescibacteria group bacterium]
MKRGFAFEKVFGKKMVGKPVPGVRPSITFYNSKSALPRPGKHHLKKLAWRPRFSQYGKFTPIKAVVTPLTRVLVSILLILVIYFIFGSNFFLLNKLEVQGNRLVDAPTIERIVFKNGFTQTNAILFNDIKAQKQILDLAQIKAVSFHKDIREHKLQIIVDEHETSLIWQTNGERFLVNRAGVVYDTASPESPLTVVEDLKNVPVDLKQQILTTDFIEFVNFVSANLSRKTPLNIRQIVVPETTFELEVVTNENWKIIFDTTKSADTQLNNLSKILKAGAQPRQYVDLRILDRVYYK